MAQKNQLWMGKDLVAIRESKTIYARSDYRYMSKKILNWFSPKKKNKEIKFVDASQLPSSKQIPSKQIPFKQKYYDYLNSKIWRAKRLLVLDRDKSKCQKCGAKKNLFIHHLTYKRIYKEELSDLLTLCGICHKKEHNN